MNKGLLLLGLGITLLVQSCSSGDKKETKSEELTDNTEITEMQEEPEPLDIVFPSPLQVASIFKRSGLTYIENVTNDPNKVETYDSQMRKSLNFGVYGADLAYCVLNNQTQKSLEYLANVKDLSNDLGISTVFQADELFATFENNMGNEDSLIYVIAGIQERLDDYIQMNEMNHLSTIYFAGGWVEAMHMGSRVLEASDDKKLTQHMLEQTLLLETIVRAFDKSPYKEDPLISELHKQLKEFDTLVNSFEYIKDRPIEEIPLDEIILTNEEVKSLIEMASKLRSTIVNV